MNLTEFQKKIIKYLLKFKPQGIEYTLSTFIEYIFSMNEFKNVGVEIKNDQIKLYIMQNTEKSKEINTKEYIELRDKGFEVFKLIYKLISNEYLSCIEVKKFQKKTIEKSFSFRLKPEYNHEVIIPFELKEINTIYIKRNHFIYISSDLKKYQKDEFRTKDELDTFYMRRALWASIIFPLLGIVAQYYIAKNINTVVEFAMGHRPIDETIINFKK